MPVNAAGIRTEPPPSVPTDQRRPCRARPRPRCRRWTRPVSCAGSHGLRGDAVRGAVGDALPASTPGSSSCRRCTAPRLAQPRDRRRVLVPRARSRRSACCRAGSASRGSSNTSLIDVGTPSPGPSGSPACHRASDSCAAGQRALGVHEHERVDLRVVRASIASSAAGVASTGESSFRRYASMRSTARIIGANLRGYSQASCPPR